jgi:hypothetical protein
MRKNGSGSSSEGARKKAGRGSGLRGNGARVDLELLYGSGERRGGGKGR